MWGLVQPAFFVRLNVLMFFENVCKNQAFATIVKKYRKFSAISDKTLQRNVKKIRKALLLTFEHEIDSGDYDSWEYARKKDAPTENPYSNSNLLLDSVDIPRWGTTGIRKEDLNWSYKADGCATKFFIISDFSGYIRYLSNDVFPKTYDGQWTLSNKEMLEEKFPKAKILADNHFQIAEKAFSRLLLVCNPGEEIRGRPKANPTEEQKQSTKQQLAEMKTKSRWISMLRGSVESRFAQLGKIFTCLHTTFRGEPPALNQTMRLACIILNMKKRLRTKQIEDED